MDVYIHAVCDVVEEELFEEIETCNYILTFAVEVSNLQWGGQGL